MKKMLPAAVLIIGLTMMCSDCHAAEDSNDGRMKFSFDTLPFLGGSDKGGESEQEPSAASDQEEVEYTYDAMGRKVPVRTGAYPSH